MLSGSFAPRRRLLAFSQLFYTQLGPFMLEYVDQQASLISLARALFGDFDIDVIQKNSQGYLMVVLFIAYLFVAVFIMLSMFFAILGESQANLRDDQRDDEREYAKKGLLPPPEYGILTETINGIQRAIRWLAPSVSKHLAQSFHQKAESEVHRRASAVDRVEARQLEMLDKLEDLKADLTQNHMPAVSVDGCSAGSSNASSSLGGGATHCTQGDCVPSTAASEATMIKMMLAVKDLERKQEKVLKEVEYISASQMNADKDGSATALGSSPTSLSWPHKQACPEQHLTRASTKSPPLQQSTDNEADTLRALEQRDSREVLQADGDKLRVVSSKLNPEPSETKSSGQSSDAQSNPFFNSAANVFQKLAAEKSSQTSIKQAREADVAAMKKHLAYLVERRQMGAAAFIIDPRNSQHLSLWDGTVACGLAFTVIITPYEVSFVHSRERSTRHRNACVRVHVRAHVRTRVGVCC